jgi:integrase
MDEQSTAVAKLGRKPKEALDSRSFMDGAIYLFRRADYKKPTWFCRVKVPRRTGYISCSTKTTDEHKAYAFAEDLYNKTLAQVLSGRDFSSKKIAQTITDYVKALEERTNQKYSIKLKIMFLKRSLPFFGNLRIKEVTTAKLSEFLDWTRKNSRDGQLSENTVKRYVTDLKQFFSWCLDRGYIEAMPRFPSVKADHARRPHFNNADWTKLTRHMREFLKVKDGNRKTTRDRTMLVNYVLILANTGIRVGEARNLKWRDLREIPQPKGTNQPPDIALYVTGKTGPREVVARTSDVKEYFKRILEMRKAELENMAEGKKPKKLGPDDYIFCNRDGTPITSFKKSFTALLKSAKVETDSHGHKRTIYSLRHTYATFRLQEGVHQFILARNMGTSTAMLEKHYGHTSNVASAAELTKGGNFKGDKKVKALDWL